MKVDRKRLGRAIEAMNDVCVALQSLDDLGDRALNHRACGLEDDAQELRAEIKRLLADLEAR